MHVSEFYPKYWLKLRIGDNAVLPLNFCHHKITGKSMDELWNRNGIRNEYGCTQGFVMIANFFFADTLNALKSGDFVLRVLPNLNALKAYE